MAELDMEPQWLDEAARAAWLYYVGGRTQDQIAQTLGVSRQRAQRLVARAVADGLIEVRLRHPVSDLMQLGRDVRDAYGLKRVRVAPDLGVDGNMRSLAPFAAGMMEEVFQSKSPRVIGFGTGRALRATVDSLHSVEAPHHRLLSIIGNVAPDGTANFYDVLMRVADIVRAPHYPLMTPVLAESPEEKEAYMRLSAVRKSFELAEELDTIFVGVGQFDETAPMQKDGFINAENRQEFLRLGAVGEIGGRAFDANGEYIENHFSERITSMKVESREGLMIVGIASGERKTAAVRAALKGHKINALVTDEPTAKALLGISD